MKQGNQKKWQPVSRKINMFYRFWKYFLSGHKAGVRNSVDISKYSFCKAVYFFWFGYFDVLVFTFCLNLLIDKFCKLVIQHWKIFVTVSVVSVAKLRVNDSLRVFSLNYSTCLVIWCEIFVIENLRFT